MGGGGLFSGASKFLKKYEDYAVHLADPVGSIFRSKEENRVFMDPINITGMQTDEGETLQSSTISSGTSATELEEKARLAAQAESERTKKRKGYKSTVLTSMSGDMEDVTTLKKTLGGV
jgi:cysteine synthase